jgi:hypothetical protein
MTNESMPEQGGPSLGAIQARQSALAGRHGAASDADRVLAEALAGAHAATRDSVRRLDAIAEEIDRADLQRGDLAADTPMGARELHRFLVDKQREIARVVSEAREVARAKRAVLEGLRAHYGLPAG